MPFLEVCTWRCSGLKLRFAPKLNVEEGNWDHVIHIRKGRHRGARGRQDRMRAAHATWLLHG